MSKTNRRTFVKATAVAASGAAAIGFPTLVLGQRGANERIRVGLVGLGGRMHSHIGSLAAIAQTDNVEIAAICDCDQSKLDAAAKAYPGIGRSEAEDLHRPAQAVRRQVDRRHQFRHPGPLARPADDLGLPGGQGRVRRKAAHLVHLGRAQDGRSGAQVRAHGADRHPEPLQSRTSAKGCRNCKEGVIGKLYMARGYDLQDARQPGKAQSAARARQGWIGTPGWARPRWSSTATSSIAAGTGSRTSPAATWPTSRSTTSTRSAGAWDCRTIRSP